MCKEGILIKGSELNLRGQGGFKWIWVEFKRSLIEVIIPSGGMQPPAHLWRDGALLCKVVITSTHALPQHPRGFPIVKLSKLLTLYSQLECIVSGVGASEKSYKVKVEKETHWSHNYLWNLPLGYIGFQRSDSNQHQCVSLLQNTPKHLYRPSLDPTPNI